MFCHIFEEPEAPMNRQVFQTCLNIQHALLFSSQSNKQKNDAAAREYRKEEEFTLFLTVPRLRSQTNH